MNEWHVKEKDWRGIKHDAVEKWWLSQTARSLRVGEAVETLFKLEFSFLSGCWLLYLSAAAVDVGAELVVGVELSTAW